MKKRIFNLTIFALIWLFSVSLISAQEKEITETEFNKIVSNAVRNLENKTYRLTETEKYFPDKNGEAERTEINLTEIVLPDKRRTVKEIKSPTENSKYERIWDGKNLYTRKNNENWEKFSGGGSENKNSTRSIPAISAALPEESLPNS